MDLTPIIHRELPDGRYMEVRHITFGRARLCLGEGMIYEGVY